MYRDRSESDVHGALARNATAAPHRLAMRTEDQTDVMSFPSTAEARVSFDVLRRIAGAYGELSSLAGWRSGDRTEVRTFSETRLGDNV